MRGNQNRDMRPIDWAREAARSIMQTHTADQLPPANRWHYHQGVFLFGLLTMWKHTKEETYFEYIKRYVDHLIDPLGNFLFNREELDSIQAGVLLFDLYEETGEQKYRIAAEKLKNLFYTLNRTSDGGFWHKDKYPYQMWLDGLYMGGSFAVRYASHFQSPELIEMAVEQERLMRLHCKDERTGLYYHAWDESGTAAWSDPDTGQSPEFWGRALGWYALALPDFLDYVPQGHRARATFIDVLKHMLEAIGQVQDSASGLWYQVLNRGDRSDNWLETSCSSLFVHSLAKSVRHGYVDEEFRPAAERGFKGLLGELYFNDNGLLQMPGICIGTGVGDYEHYIGRPTSVNDLHGVGAFLLACVEMERLDTCTNKKFAQGVDAE